MLVLPSTVAELAALGREFSLWQGFSSLCTQQQPPRLGMQNLPWHATVTAWVTATVCCSPALAQQVGASLAQLLRGPEHPVPSPWQHQQQLRAVPQHRECCWSPEPPPLGCQPWQKALHRLRGFWGALAASPRQCLFSHPSDTSASGQCLPWCLQGGHIPEFLAKRRCWGWQGVRYQAWGALGGVGDCKSHFLPIKCTKRESLPSRLIYLAPELSLSPTWALWQIFGVSGLPGHAGLGAARAAP